MGVSQTYRKVDDQFRILTDHALECIWTYDIQADRFTFISPSVSKLTGFTVDEVMHQPFSGFLPPATAAKVIKTIARFMKRYQNGERREDRLTHCGDYALLCKDQSVKQVEITAKLIFDPEAGTPEILGITRDVTRRKQLEIRLNRALKTKNAMIQSLQDAERASKALVEELHQKNQDLRRRATQDDLTGICNRYAFDQTVARETNRCQRYRHPLSVALFDIDGFKEINDTLGHQTGDAVLVDVVTAVQGQIRAADTLARWGGDEFILLMPQTPLTEAVFVAEKTRQKIETIHPGNARAPVTASFGVVELFDGESADSWFRRADYALLRSKSNGKNRVTAMDREAAIPFVQIRLEWKPAWECGNPTIDGQHKMLVALGNILLDEAMADMTSQRTADALDDLVAHIVTHFEDEERILRQAGYPCVQEHAEIHRALAAQAQTLLTQFQGKTLKSSFIFSFILDEVVTGHLLKEDVLYFSCIKTHNRSGAQTEAN